MVKIDFDDVVADFQSYCIYGFVFTLDDLENTNKDINCDTWESKELTPMSKYTHIQTLITSPYYAANLEDINYCVGVNIDNMDLDYLVQHKNEIEQELKMFCDDNNLKMQNAIMRTFLHIW